MSVEVAARLGAGYDARRRGQDATPDRDTRRTKG